MHVWFGICVHYDNKQYIFLSDMTLSGTHCTTFHYAVCAVLSINRYTHFVLQLCTSMKNILEGCRDGSAKNHRK